MTGVQTCALPICAPVAPARGAATPPPWRLPPVHTAGAPPLPPIRPDLRRTVSRSSSQPSAVAWVSGWASPSSTARLRWTPAAPLRLLPRPHTRLHFPLAMGLAGSSASLPPSLPRPVPPHGAAPLTGPSAGCRNSFILGAASPPPLSGRGGVLLPQHNIAAATRKGEEGDG